MDLLSSLKQHTGDDVEARELHPEIDTVIEDFSQLEAQAQAKQQRLKENRYTVISYSVRICFQTILQIREITCYNKASVLICHDY